MAGDQPKPVLVVLEDDAYAALVYAAIERAGFRPFLARNAREAHALLERQLEPCVVLFSLTSAEEGRAFLARQAASDRATEIPVIFFPVSTNAADAAAPIVSALIAFVRTYCETSPAENGSSALH